MALFLSPRARVLGRRRPGAVHGLADTEPLRAFLAQSVDPGGIDATIVYGRLRSVALSAMSYTTGRSVTFVQGAADTPTWERAERIAMRTRLTLDHVMASARSEEHTSELQSQSNLVCRLLLEKKKKNT